MSFAKRAAFFSVLVGGMALGASMAHASTDSPFDLPATFSTVFLSPLPVEGLATDASGNLYAAGRGGNPCPVYRVPAGGGSAAVVGTLPAPCSPNGLEFDAHGDLYVTNGADKIYRLTPNDQAPPLGSLFASGVPGANGIAFDARGRLWVTDGGTGQGRVWRVAQDGTVVEVFRVQPLASDVNAVAGPNGVATGGVGRDARALPPGSITFAPGGRSAAADAGSLGTVANGVVFDREGALLIADTTRGAVWRVLLREDGSLRSRTGCDAAFPADTSASRRCSSSTRRWRDSTASRSTRQGTSGASPTSETRWWW